MTGASIPARDQDGKEHCLLVVDHPAGLVTLFDDEMRRVMEPKAAVALVLELLHALGGGPLDAAQHWRS